MTRIWKAVVWGIVLVVVCAGAYFGLFNPGAAKGNKILVFLPATENAFWVEVRRGAEAAAQSTASRYTVTIAASSDQDASAQIQQLQAGRGRKDAAAIVVGLANNRAPAPVISQYNSDGVKVVLIDTKLDPAAAEATGAKPDAFIGSDNKRGGKLAAEAVLRGVGTRTGPIILLKGSFVHQSAIDRSEGFLEALKGSVLSDRIQTFDGEWSRQRAADIVSGALARGPIAAIFASNDDMALGAVGALKAVRVGQDRWPVIVGFDATEPARQAIARGEMYASIVQNPYKLGADGVTLAVDLIEGKAVPNPDQLVSVSVFPADRQGKQ